MRVKRLQRASDLCVPGNVGERPVGFKVEEPPELVQGTNIPLSGLFNAHDIDQPHDQGHISWSKCASHIPCAVGQDVDHVFIVEHSLGIAFQITMFPLLRLLALGRGKPRYDLGVKQIAVLKVGLDILSLEDVFIHILHPLGVSFADS